MATYTLKFRKNDASDNDIHVEVNVPCRRRAAIYNDFLVIAYNTLFGKFGNVTAPALSFSDASRSLFYSKRFSCALQNKELIESLARIMDQYVASGVMADFNRCRTHLYCVLQKEVGKPSSIDDFALDGFVSDAKFFNSADENNRLKCKSLELKKYKEHGQAYADYFNWVIDRKIWVGHESRKAQRELLDGLDAFFIRNPRTKYAIDKQISHFLSNIRLLIDRLSADWKLIGEFFGDELEKLSAIECTGSDFHKGGQQVLILTFSTRSCYRKLVYKPRDVEADCYLVGCIEDLGKVKDTLLSRINDDKEKFEADIIDVSRKNYFLTGKSLSEILNGAMRDDGCSLPTYKILPRFPGSLFLTKETTGIPVRESYGYVEFLSHEEHDYNNATQNDAEIFYSVWGKLIAMARLFSIADLHVQNVITHGNKPCLIDLEDSFKRKFNELADTFIFSGKMRVWGAIDSEHDPGEFSYVISMDEARGFFVTQHSFSDVDGLEQNGKNRVSLNGEKYPLKDYVDRLAKFFEKTITKVVANEALYVFLEDIEMITTRYVAEGTWGLVKAKSALYGWLCSHGACDPSAIVNELGKDISRIGAGIEMTVPDSRAFGVTWDSLNAWLLWSADNNLKDFSSLDIPFYVHRLNDANLYNSSGFKVNADENAATDGNKKTYLPEPSMAAVRTQIQFADKTALVEELRKQLKQLSINMNAMSKNSEECEAARVCRNVF
ncbi:DUF4135 domain-containing protein [Candidatus Methylospira mobilis]|uniref:DUF4135 domain-containing protein n=1 Tax=Candidatus Methylospira mobilis TaxID=1808979 RepID=UPI0028F163EA|nr:DUF4135 domain-containing protein [Candidatus Methylospira mobilis]WNV03788.1 DUF4135 domain-containing protein [Candidatus Methylospira mobilis]